MSKRLKTSQFLPKTHIFSKKVVPIFGYNEMLERDETLKSLLKFVFDVLKSFSKAKENIQIPWVLKNG